jgi:hypothetical protein
MWHFKCSSVDRNEFCLFLMSRIIWLSANGSDGRYNHYVYSKYGHGPSHPAGPRKVSAQDIILATALRRVALLSDYELCLDASLVLREHKHECLFLI